MTIALRMVADKLRGLPDFPPPLRTLLEHMILSHHGQLEFGSPKLPQFPEALLLHYLDDLDSKMECMRALIENDRQVEGCFTTWNTALERSALKKDRFLNGKAPGPEGTPEVAPPGPVGAPAAEPSEPDSPFAGKLKQALRPGDTKQEV
jgi:3'-5' exoribonuclease